MDNELKRKTILDNYMNPSNKEIPSDSNYIKANTNNVSCIDNLDIYVLIEDNIIKDIKFDGEACAIATSAASIMTKLLQNKTISEVKELYNNYKEMLESGNLNNILGDAQAFSDIYKQPNRKTCAILPWEGIIKAINEYEKS